MIRSLPFVALAVVALALPLEACEGAAPAAYPSVRYEREPFPPPPARTPPSDAGPTTAPSPG